ncbi:DUF1799 domain-containing protein [Pragia fontium]|uniref:DUF1799 domain-containing protein n=1 Tax=Pragia fontium TaxID=82985 RepID=UPI0006492B11|nr:DUF1799 domain-containing protein [Pragia fontium]AKJ41477.1 hypothetical protein QQ39_04765 [Pragia fontium]
MAAAGLSPDDFEDQIIEILPDVLPSFNVFKALSTQWRRGMDGPTGLDYGCLQPVMELMEIKNKATVFEDIRQMERAALSVMYKG